LQLRFTRPEDQKSLGLPQLPDDLVVVSVQMLVVAFLVVFLNSAALWRSHPSSGRLWEEGLCTTERERNTRST